ncbi:MAG TPA: ABC transporter permease [Streptosporangiaceae bacterium]|nr:ABC transporter permease [Streptosporangiaceae bacterium]
MSASAGPAGVIHDIGYRSYDGQRLGRAAIVRALTWHSLRAAFGLRRGVKAKIIPVTTFVVMCLPAVVNAAAVALSGDHSRQVSYDTYTASLRVLVLVAFLAAQAPELVSRDLRSHVLPLYFARPIRRADYPLAKLAAFFLACLIMIEVPLLLLYLGTVSQVHGGSAIWAQTRALIPGLLLGVAWAAVLSGLGLLLASFTGRRAFATGAVAVYFLLTLTLAQLLTSIGENDFGARGLAHPSALAQVAGVISPFTVLDGLRQWLGGTTPGTIPDPGSYGPAYGLAFLLLLVIGAGGLVLRYRKVGVA